MTDQRQFARRRPDPVPISRHDALEVLRGLRKDSRYRNLTPLGRQALAWAVTDRMDRNGVWWTKWENWAEAIGCHRDSLRSALRPAREPDLLLDPLVIVTPYLRPPRKGQDDKKRQGSNIYQLDPVLLVTRVGDGPHRGEGEKTHSSEGEKGGSRDSPKNVLKRTTLLNERTELLMPEMRFAPSGVDMNNSITGNPETIELLRQLADALPDADEETGTTYVKHFAELPAWEVRDVHRYLLRRLERVQRGQMKPIDDHAAYVFEALAERLAHPVEEPCDR